MSRHKWLEIEDAMALYLHRFGDRLLPWTLAEVARARGIDPGSMKQRIANLDYLDGRGNRSHVAEQTRRVHAKYSGYSEPALRAIAFPSLPR